jgi:hypothetical protein
MVNITYEHILNRLRLHERLGQTTPPLPQGSGPDSDSETAQELNRLTDSLKVASSIVGIYTNAVKQLNIGHEQLSMGLGKVIGVQDTFNTHINTLVKNITFLEERNSRLNKSFGLTSHDAQELAENLREIGIELKYGDLTMMAAAESLNDFTAGMFNSSKVTTDTKKSLLNFNAIATKNIGLTAEQALGFEQYARNVGSTGEAATLAIHSITDELSKATGLKPLQLQKTIMAEIGELASDVRVHYSKYSSGLEIAVLKAKMLGMTMADIKRSGEASLDIEQAVGAEIQYQALTGKQLLVDGNKSYLQEMQIATVRRDGAKQAELLGKLYIAQGDTIDSTVGSMEAFAKTTGQSVEQVSTSLEKLKLAKSIGATQLMTLSGEKLKDEIKRLQTEFKGNEKDTKALQDFISLGDTRTTHEKVVEDNLVTISKTIAAIGGVAKRNTDGTFDTTKGRNITVGGINKNLPGRITGSFDKIKTSLDGLVQPIGKITLLSETMTTLTKPIGDVAGRLPILGTAAQTLTDKFKKLATIDLKTGIADGGKTVSSNDLLIMPDKGPMIRPAKNDVIAAFRPNDIIHRTVTGMTQPNNRTTEIIKPATNDRHMEIAIAALNKTLQSMQTQNNNVNVTMDTTKLANDIKLAMQSVKIEAKMRTDDLYSSNRLNNRKNII